MENSYTLHKDDLESINDRLYNPIYNGDKESWVHHDVKILHKYFAITETDNLLMSEFLNWKGFSAIFEKFSSGKLSNNSLVDFSKWAAEWVIEETDNNPSFIEYYTKVVNKEDVDIESFMIDNEDDENFSISYNRIILCVLLSAIKDPEQAHSSLNCLASMANNFCFDPNQNKSYPRYNEKGVKLQHALYKLFVGEDYTTDLSGEFKLSREKVIVLCSIEKDLYQRGLL